MAELTFLAYHLHLPLDALLDLEHRDRRAWVVEVSALNARRNEA
jgi:hypothetical protein